MSPDVNETSHDCTAAQCAQIRRERDDLLAAIRDLSHSQLISRDVELGLRAELVQARIDLIHSEGRTKHVADSIRNSTTWRIGRLFTKPLGIGSRLLGKGN